MTLESLIALAKAHACAIAIGAPLAGALGAALSPGPRTALSIALVALTVSFAFALMAAVSVMAHGPIAYIITEGLALRIDAWSGVLAAIGCGLALPAFLIGAPVVVREAEPGPACLTLAAGLVVVAAMVAATYAAHLALVVLALQITGLAGVTLVAASAGEPRAPGLNAALRLLAAFGVAGALGWFGVGLVMAGTGTADPASALASLALGPPALAGLLLIGLGLALTGLIAPLDHWGASVLGRGPVLAAVLGVAVIGPLAFAAFARVMGLLADLGAGLAAGVCLIALGSAGALVAGVQALAARDLRRLAGYAFAAQAGCALLGLALATPAGAAAAALKLAGGALAALLLVAAATAETELEQLDGLARRAPLAGLCAALGCFLLMSAPFTLGYAGSWALVEAALARGWWAAAALAVAVSLAGVVFGGRILERIYFRAPHVEAKLRRGPLQGMGLILAALLAVVAGFAGAPLTAWAEAAGAALSSWPSAAAALDAAP